MTKSFTAGKYVALSLIAVIAASFISASPAAGADDAEPAREWLDWIALPDLPDEFGVAGPFVGVHQNPARPDDEVLIVAGGANFPISPGGDPWEAEKIWHDEVWVLTRSRSPTGGYHYEWLEGYQLDRPRAYGASVSTPYGVLCMGGNDSESAFDDSFLLQWDQESRSLRQVTLPPLPSPCAFGSATMIGDVVYLAGGQGGTAADTEMNNFWALDLSALNRPGAWLEWRVLPSWPGPPRVTNLTIAQNNGFDTSVYVISGRRHVAGRQGLEAIEPLVDVYEFNPSRYDAGAFNTETGAYEGKGEFAQPWRQRADAPTSVSGGTGMAVGQSHIFAISGVDREAIYTSNEQKNDYRGFPRTAYAYHTITDTWIKAGTTPLNQITSPATAWDGSTFLISGEIRPRVRTAQAWRITPRASTRHGFGPVNMAVLALYLLGMLGIGLFFMRRNNNTDDFFRGGKRIPWWVAGCSIYATMLSSITFMAVPAKAYAQDWVYLLGSLMMAAVAPIAVYIALPFFRQIDATSAYEYLQRRFHWSARLFGSASFTLFHVFRMGIVMSLAGLALATVTDFTPAQCVTIMGVLSIIYCTLGGIEAVVWSDTVQTFVLMGGAILCLCFMIANIDGGVGTLWSTAVADEKFRMVNLHWDATSQSMALWVVLLGAFGQNLTSYTADQAVVQRYMTTPDRKRAARAIWTNVLLTIPGSLLFFLLGTGLYAYYKSHPARLDPTAMTDQIFPLFISRQVPIGLAGLIVAGIFAAAQSTVSTSMNSTATTVLTDFIRPLGLVRSERTYLNLARALTLLLGITGTLLGLFFIDPQITSLFDSFIKVIGLFMGVLGGLFCLGALTTRANAWGALTGALAGAAIMGFLPLYTAVHGYLYAVIGILSCVVIGYLASLIIPARQPDLTNLTLLTLQRRHSEAVR